MSFLDVIFLALALVAGAGAVAAMVSARRARAETANQRIALRAALDLAGTDDLADVVDAFIVARRRADSLAALAPAADELADRHRRLTVALETRDHAGSSAREALTTTFTALESAGEAVVELAHGVGEAGAAVEEAVASISTVSDNINGIANNVGSVSSSIGELAVSVNQVAGSAREASTLSVEADRKAKDGGIAVERLVRSTREIADDIKAVVGKMEELGNASERIGAIVEVIDAIADQTNLLALNAAIEAARAGEHGRGFAVVADEVRKLAESSAQSTREIGKLVKDIQGKTGEVVRSTTASGTKAETGLEMADLAGRAIADISSSVSEANRLIEQISMAAREQAVGSSAIVNSVEQMNNLMREAARSLEEQNTSNRQIIAIIAKIQRHANGVDEALRRQRASGDALLAQSKALAAAGDATKDAHAGIDDLVASFRDRVHRVASTQLVSRHDAPVPSAR
jgi:methyl-accepting chemotaxis protein